MLGTSHSVKSIPSAAQWRITGDGKCILVLRGVTRVVGAKREKHAVLRIRRGSSNSIDWKLRSASRFASDAVTFLPIYEDGGLVVSRIIAYLVLSFVETKRRRSFAARFGTNHEFIGLLARVTESHLDASRSKIASARGFSEMMNEKHPARFLNSTLPTLNCSVQSKAMESNYVTSYVAYSV